MTSDDLDQKYTSAGSTHEEYRKWIARVSDEADDTTLLRTVLSTMGEMESVLMGIYAELVYARHTTPIVAAVPTKVRQKKLQKQPRNRRSTPTSALRKKRVR